MSTIHSDSPVVHAAAAAAATGVSVAAAPAAAVGSTGVRVCSWNVLADAYSRGHGTFPTAIEWPSRGERVVERIAAQACDIVALQEVDHYRDFYRDHLLRLGYDIYYAHRNGDQTVVDTISDATDSAHASSPSPAGVAPPYGSSLDWQSRSSSKRSKTDGALIAWRRDRFRLASAPAGLSSSHVVDYDDLAFADEEMRRAEGKSAAAAGHAATSAAQRAVKFLRHNVGLFVFLTTIDDNEAASTNARTLLVANTHIYWNPMHEDVKLKQTQYLLARIERECYRRLHPTDDDVDAITTAMSSAHLAGGDASAIVAAAAAASSSIRAFQFILAGDFNSSPMSQLYGYLTQGAWERKTIASEDGDANSGSTTSSKDDASSTTLSSSKSSAPRFICDSDLVKVAKWLRSIGIDCSHYTDTEKKARGGHVGLFEHAIKEKRIIVTRSLRLLERRGCPPWFLLRSENLESSFAALILHFGLQFREDLFYSRCIFCNSEFDSYPAAYFLGGVDQHGRYHEPHDPFMDIPRGFINLGYKDEQGTVLTFTRCRDQARPWVKCGKLFWWGLRSGAAVEMFAARMDAALAQQHQEEDGPTSNGVSDDSAAAGGDAADAGSDRHTLAPSRLAELRLARDIAARDLDAERPTQSLPLTSAYAQSAVGEPSITNLTSTFSDTLDYIFFRAADLDSDTDTGLRVRGVRCVTDDARLDLAVVEKASGVHPPKVEKKKARVEAAAAAGDNDNIEAPAVEEPTTTEDAAAPPLSLVLPNLAWPSDHLLLQVDFTYQ